MDRRGNSWPFPAERTQGAAMRQATELLALEREIAEDAARTTIELFAGRVPSNFERPVWYVGEPDAGECGDRLSTAAADLQRAVRYLDMRELLVRPAPAMPQFVAFKQEAR